MVSGQSDFARLGDARLGDEVYGKSTDLPKRGCIDVVGDRAVYESNK